ncbi:MAG: helix-turn-helix domain-containing protein [Treponema sp.]|nr:helix-turn-helix domain-containing protein [Treponema sp.]
MFRVKYNGSGNCKNFRKNSFKKARKKASLLNLATEIGISHSHLYYIESKRVIPSIDVFIKIAKSLKIYPKNLFE